MLNQLTRVHWVKGERQAVVLVPILNDTGDDLLLFEGEPLVTVDEIDDSEGTEVEVDVAAVREAWGRKGAESENVGVAALYSAKEVVATVCQSARESGKLGEDVVALISEALEAESLEVRDQDGLTQGDPRFGKSGREIIAEIEEGQEGFEKWRQTWEEQVKFGEEVEEPDRIAVLKLLFAFQETIAVNPKAPPAVRGVEHSINLIEGWDKVPRRVRLRPHSQKEFEAARQEVQGLAEAGIIRPSQSPWACSIVLVPKHDGGLRTCCDFRQLNNLTVADAMNIPRIEDLLDRLGKARAISALDMAAGYHAVPMREEDCAKTAFLTWSHGLMEWVRMPMGLKNAGATYQRMLQHILGPLLWESSSNYLDDLSIFSVDSDHVDDLSRVLKRLSRWGVTVKISKCVFLANRMPFLGYLVKVGEGVTVDPEKIQSCLRSGENGLKTATDVLSFLGALEYYRKFIPDYAELSAPLRGILKGKRRRNSVEAEWAADPMCDLCFRALKTALCTAPVLAFPDFNRPFVVSTDISQAQLSAILIQVDDQGVERPVAFAGRQLTPCEQRYTVADRECLGVVFAVCRRFRKYLHGSAFPVTVITDHSSLLTLNTRVDPGGRLMRYALELSEFEYVVKHRPGRKHHLPDVLSRCELVGASPQVVADQVDEALLSRYALLLKLHRTGPVSDSQLRGIFSEDQRALRLQLLVRGSVLADGANYEETVRAIKETHRAMQQADISGLDKLAGEWSPFVEFAPVVASVEEGEEGRHRAWRAAGEHKEGERDPYFSERGGEGLTLIVAALTRAQGRRDLEVAAEKMRQAAASEKMEAKERLMPTSEEEAIEAEEGRENLTLPEVGQETAVSPQRRREVIQGLRREAGLEEELPREGKPIASSRVWEEREAKDLAPRVNMEMARRGASQEGSSLATLQEWAGLFDTDHEAALLEAQKQDVFAYTLCKYLRSGELPADTYIRGRLVKAEDQFCVDEAGLLRRIWYRDPRRRSTLEPLFQVYVPEELRGVVMVSFHGGLRSGHLSPLKTWLRMKERYWWPGMQADIYRMVQSCGVCQSRGRRPPKQRIQGHVRSDVPGEVWMLDVLHLAESSSGKKHVLTMVDVATRYAFFIALDRVDSFAVVKAVETHLIGGGIDPKLFITDNGSEFKKAFVEFCELYGVKVRRSVPHHAEGHGMVEAANRTIADIIGHMVEEDGGDWEDNLPYAQRTYNSSIHTAHQGRDGAGLSPAEAYLGRKVQMPVEARMKDYEEGAKESGVALKMAMKAQARIRKAQEWILESREDYEKSMRDTKRNRNRRERVFQLGDKVRLFKPPKLRTERKVGRVFEGPYIVVDCIRHTDIPSEYVLRREGGALEKRQRATAETLRSYVDAAAPFARVTARKLEALVDHAPTKQYEVKTIV